MRTDQQCPSKSKIRKLKLGSLSLMGYGLRSMGGACISKEFSVMAAGKSSPVVSWLRARTDVPLVLFGYYNPFFRYGDDTFARDAASAGADAVLCVDLPPEESSGMVAACRKNDLANIFLLAPTSNDTPPSIRKRRSRSPETLSRTMRRIHDGTGMPLLWQIIIFIGGILPAILAVTGILMWLRMRRRRERHRTSMGALAEAEALAN